MIVPGSRVLWLALLLVIALIGALAFEQLVLVVLAIDLMLVGAVLFVGYQLRKMPVTLNYEWPARLQVDRPADLIYCLENRGNSSVIVQIRQNWPQGVESESDTATTHLLPGEMVRVALSITPRKRGEIPSALTQFEIRTGLDVARVRRQFVTPAISVFPNLKAIADYERLKRHHATARAGIHQVRLLGSGREFDQLRNYVPDDDYRDINWKATAKQGKPITSMFRAERSQEIMLCLDCGRMMGNPVGRGTALDRAVDAAIMLAHVANHQGDRVGLALFRDVVERFLKPAGGLNAVNHIMKELIDVRPQGVFPSYAALAEAIRARQKRRSMIFVFTDLDDPQLCANLAEVLPLISRRHVMVVVSLRDPLMEKVASGPARDARDVCRVLAARELATERATHVASFAKSGARVIEADADALSLQTINTYLTLKARQLL